MKRSTKLALINALIAGLLVLAGSFTTGNITLQGFIAALAAAFIIFLTKCRDYFGTVTDKKGMKGGWFEFI